jgi:putative methyltransferase (TIGR04325 family)
VRLHTNPGLLTSRRTPGDFEPRDYPILFWLARAFRQSKTLIDLGGNVGHEYYAYRRFIRYPEGLKWTVCEVDEVCEVGQKLAREQKASGLQFTNDFQQAGGAEIMLTCGTLQYLQKDLSEMIAPLSLAPRHLLINRVPLGDGPTFFTLQNIGYAFGAYKIQNREAFINSLSLLGYRLIDQWRDARYCHIPFHPGLTVKGYSGFYFRQ